MSLHRKAEERTSYLSALSDLVEGSLQQSTSHGKIAELAELDKESALETYEFLLEKELLVGELDQISLTQEGLDTLEIIYTPPGEDFVEGFLPEPEMPLDSSFLYDFLSYIAQLNLMNALERHAEIELPKLRQKWQAKLQVVMEEKGHWT